MPSPTDKNFLLVQQRMNILWSIDAHGTPELRTHTWNLLQLQIGDQGGSLDLSDVLVMQDSRLLDIAGGKCKQWQRNMGPTRSK